MDKYESIHISKKNVRCLANVKHHPSAEFGQINFWPKCNISQTEQMGLPRKILIAIGIILTHSHSQSHLSILYNIPAQKYTMGIAQHGMVALVCEAVYALNHYQFLHRTASRQMSITLHGCTNHVQPRNIILFPQNGCCCLVGLLCC